MEQEPISAIEQLQKSLQVVKSRQPAFPISDVLLCRLIHFSNKTMEQIAADTLAPEGLLLSHWMVIAMLYGSADFRRRPQELSMAIGHSGPNTTKTTVFLIEKGWVTRIPDLENRRSCWMELTPAGRTQVEHLLPKMWNAYLLALSPLSDSEKETLTRLMNKMLTGKKLPCTNK